MALERESLIYSASTNAWLCDNHWPTENYFTSYLSPYNPVVANKVWVCMEIRIGKNIFLPSRWGAEFLRQDWLVRKANYKAEPAKEIEHISPLFCINKNCKKCLNIKELHNLRTKRHVQTSVFKK